MTNDGRTMSVNSLNSIPSWLKQNGIEKSLDELKAMPESELKELIETVNKTAKVKMILRGPISEMQSKSRRSSDSGSTHTGLYSLIVSVATAIDLILVFFVLPNISGASSELFPLIMSLAVMGVIGIIAGSALSISALIQGITPRAYVGLALNLIFILGMLIYIAPLFSP